MNIESWAGIRRTVGALREHIARCDPGSLWISVCDEWLWWLEWRPGNPVVLHEISRDLGPDGDLTAVELPCGNPHLDLLRACLADHVGLNPELRADAAPAAFALAIA